MLLALLVVRDICDSDDVWFCGGGCKCWVCVMDVVEMTMLVVVLVVDSDIRSPEIINYPYDRAIEPIPRDK